MNHTKPTTLDRSTAQVPPDETADTALVTLDAQPAIGPLRWTPEFVALVKRTAVQALDAEGHGPSDDEFGLFLHVAKRTGLDPLLREIWLIPRRQMHPEDKRRNVPPAKARWITTWQTMAGRDGYLAAAHRSGQFAGMTTKVYPEDPTKLPTHATCEVHRKDFAVPTVVTVAFAEYVLPTPFWRDKRRTMIGKVVEAQALRRAFSLHGTYTEEEVAIEDRAAAPSTDDRLTALRERIRERARAAAAPAAEAPKDTPAAEAPPDGQTPLPTGDPVVAAIRAAAFARMADMTPEAAKALCQRVTGKASRKDCTADDWRAIHAALDEAERADAALRGAEGAQEAPDDEAEAAAELDRIAP